MEPVEPVEPGEPVEPVKPVKPLEPLEPVESVDERHVLVAQIDDTQRESAANCRRCSSVAAQLSQWLGGAPARRLLAGPSESESARDNHDR